VEWRRPARACCPELFGFALAAGAEDLYGVTDVGETVVLGDALRPRLDGRSFDLDGVTAVPTDEMVMVSGRAAPIDRFSRVDPQHVDSAGIRERLQRAVDGGETDTFAAAAKFVVQVLRRAELLDVVQ
jgi:hypothetical protein